MAAPMVDAGTPLNIATLLNNAEQEVRAGFICKVYGTLSVQLLITVLLAVPLQQMTQAQAHANFWVLIVSSCVLVLTMCALIWRMEMRMESFRKYPRNYAVLGLITLCMSVIVGFVSAMYTWQSFLLAAGITAGIFLGMAILAWTTSIDFTGYRAGALVAMMVFSFALSIMALCGVQIEWLMMFYNFLGVLLFTMYIVFYTQMIVGGNHQVQFSIDDCAFASLYLYVDISNLFLHLIRLLGNRK